MSEIERLKQASPETWRYLYVNANEQALLQIANTPQIGSPIDKARANEELHWRSIFRDYQILESELKKFQQEGLSLLEAQYRQMAEAILKVRDTFTKAGQYGSSRQILYEGEEIKKIYPVYLHATGEALHRHINHEKLNEQAVEICFNWSHTIFWQKLERDFATSFINPYINCGDSIRPNWNDFLVWQQNELATVANQYVTSSTQQNSAQVMIQSNNQNSGITAHTVNIIGDQTFAQNITENAINPLSAKSFFKKIWHDPVWSKVIATGILAIISVVGIYLHLQESPTEIHIESPNTNVAVVESILASAKPAIVETHRNLTDKQKAEIFSTLTPYVKYQINLILYWKRGNADAQNYGQNWAEILEKLKRVEGSRWTIINAGDLRSTATGVVIQTKYPISDAHTTDEIRAISKAFEKVFKSLKSNLNWGANASLNDNQIYLGIGG